MISETQKEHYYEHGYLIVRNLYDLEQVDRWKHGVKQILDRALSGKGNDVTWINKEKGIPDRIGNMLNPGYSQQELSDSLEHSAIIDIIEGLLEQPVRYSLFGMLASGDGRGYVQGWHRDLTAANGPFEVTAIIRDIREICQINAALFEDSYLTIVPGSHLRKLSEVENAILGQDPAACLPTELTVKLAAGDAVFYYPNLLHRGYNPEGNFRWTLHHAFRTAQSPLQPYEGKPEWIKGSNRDEFGPRIRMLFDRYDKVASQS